MHKASIIYAVNGFEVTVSTPAIESKDAALLFCNTSRLSIRKRPLGLILTGLGMKPTKLTDDEITVSNIQQETQNNQVNMKKGGWGTKDLAKHISEGEGEYCMKITVFKVPNLKQ